MSIQGAATTEQEIVDPETRSPDGGLRKTVRSWATGLDWLPIVVVFAAMLVGGILRLYDIGDVPRGFNQDEAVYSYDAWSLAGSGRDHLGHPLNLIGFESYGDWTPPAQVILLTPAAALFGLDIVPLRAWNALLAIAVIPLIYWLGQILFGKVAPSLIAAWIVALLPWHVTQSRWIIPAAIVPAVVVLLMIALAKAAKQQSAGWVIAIAITAGIGLATYQSLRGYVPILMFAAVVAWWRRFLAVGFGPLALATLVFAMIAVPTYGFLFLDEAGGARMGEVSIFNERSPYLPAGETVDLGFLVEQYLDYYGPDFLLREGGEYYPWVLPRNVGALPIAVVLSALLGIGALIWRAIKPRDDWQRGVSIFLLISLALYALPGAISLPGPAAPRVIHGIPVIALIASFGVYELGRAALDWSRVLSRTVRAGLVTAGGIALALLFAGQSAQQMDRYFANYANETSYDFHYGIEESLEFALRNQSLYDEIWVVHVNEPYIYLLFQEEIDPADARARMTMQRYPGAYNWVTAFDNFRFPARIWFEPPEEIRIDEMTTTFQTHYPNGEVAYEVRTGEVPGRGLVMVIFKPQWL